MEVCRVWYLTWPRFEPPNLGMRRDATTLPTMWLLIYIFIACLCVKFPTLYDQAILEWLLRLIIVSVDFYFMTVSIQLWSDQKVLMFWWVGGSAVSVYLFGNFYSTVKYEKRNHSYEVSYATRHLMTTIYTNFLFLWVSKSAEACDATRSFFIAFVVRCSCNLHMVMLILLFSPVLTLQVFPACTISRKIYVINSATQIFRPRLTLLVTFLFFYGYHLL